MYVSQLGRPYQNLWTGGLSNRHLFSYSAGDRKSKRRVPAQPGSGEPSSCLADQATWWGDSDLFLSPPSSKPPHAIVRAPPVTSSNLRPPLQRPLSKYHHITGWGFNMQIWEDTNTLSMKGAKVNCLLGKKFACYRRLVGGDMIFQWPLFTLTF